MISITQMHNAFVSKNGRDILDFPLHVPMGMTIGDFLEDTFDKYCKLLEYVQENLKVDIDVAKVKKLCSDIKNVLEEYCKGNLSKAYSTFKDDVMKVAFGYIPTFELKGSNIFYRMRNVKGLQNARDFFPLPPNLRYLAGGQRFSLPGYSCLYLGCSEEVCKKEIGNKGTMVKVTVKAGETFKLLDLTFQKELEKKFIIVWPLVAACYIVPFYCLRGERVCEPSKINFSEEYIIPQFLSSYIHEMKPEFSGIRYYTVQDKDLDPLVDKMKNVMLFNNGGYAYDDKFTNRFEWEVL